MLYRSWRTLRFVWKLSGASLNICTHVQLCLVLMYLTVDTSALIAVIGREPSCNAIIDISRGYSLCAPYSVHWEIGNAFAAMFKRQRISLDQAHKALAVYREIPIKFMSLPLEVALNIAHSQQMYAYDAYLILCAQQTRTPLLTLDKQLAGIAINIGISVLEINA